MTPPSPASPDPRIAEIRQRHEQGYYSLYGTQHVAKDVACLLDALTASERRWQGAEHRIAEWAETCAVIDKARNASEQARQAAEQQVMEYDRALKSRDDAFMKLQAERVAVEQRASEAEQQRIAEVEHWVMRYRELEEWRISTAKLLTEAEQRVTALEAELTALREAHDKTQAELAIELLAAESSNKLEAEKEQR